MTWFELLLEKRVPSKYANTVSKLLLKYDLPLV